MSATLGLALVALGALGVLGPGPHGVYFLYSVPLVCAVGGIIGVGLLVQDFGLHALALLLCLPFLGGPYLAGLHVAHRLGPVVGVAALLGGVVALGLGLWGPRQVTPAAGGTA
jgi:hypothetical protein